MSLHSETAGLAGRGGSVVSEAVAAQYYLTTAPTVNATDLAAAIIGARFGLTEYMARLVCELSGIGGRA